ncbi:sulfotransferase family protein [Shewanella benthica]|uniref:sulfotransferase family 2 domain-containing protein n=1 Tax=Shewanella benthica TaxID=43661 RepID=UPI00187A5979|nr:sulfotransferase family 2 domain-containing protein [Shewanella benthica]MBE7213924.1 sulfotransferase family 2 domain-containing protein [Shewanella benthica]MCL1061830.1 sulfotransferase family protein [Shewanella benthica]
MISDKHKCIFVHIPKVAGTSIESLIWPGQRDVPELWMGFIDKFHNKYQTGGLQHLLASQIKLEVGRECFDSYFKFSFVRNPWDKVISQYRYMSNRVDLREFIGMSSACSLTEYLHLIIKKEHVQWMPQHQFILDHNGECLVDFVGHFESFNLDADIVLRKLDLQKEIPHLNSSNRIEYQSYYDAETIGMVADMYKTDIKLFNYSYG